MRTLILGVVLALAASYAGGQESNPVPRQPSLEVSVGGKPRLIVTFRSGSDSPRTTTQGVDAMAKLASRYEAGLKSSAALTSRVHVVELDSALSGESLETLLADVRADSAVAYAEVDQRRYPHAVPDDALFPRQWYFQRPAAALSAIDAEGAWEMVTGDSDVTVAVLDTGVLFDHPDLLDVASGGRLLPGYDFVSDVAAANDGDGRDADATDPGDWVTQFEADAAMFVGCSARASSWHGTRVAGLIGALSNNSDGISGATWSGSILPVRVLGKCGGFDSDILAGMLWAGGIPIPGVPANPYPAKILNMSLGSIGPCPRPYQEVIDALGAQGVHIVVSAGNEGGPVAAPASCSGVVAVAGLRHAGTKVGFSSLGPEIIVSAPAGNCVNAVGPCLFSIDTTSNLGMTTRGSHSFTDQFDINVGTRSPPRSLRVRTPCCPPRAAAPRAATKSTLTTGRSSKARWRGHLDFISPEGLYTAPAVVLSRRELTVTAVSSADSIRRASARVTVVPSTPPVPAARSSSGGGGGALEPLTLALLFLLCLAAIGRRASSVDAGRAAEPVSALRPGPNCRDTLTVQLPRRRAREGPRRLWLRC